LLFVVNTNSSKAITESYLNISTGGSTNAFYIDSIKNVVSNSFGYGINYYPDSSKFGYFADLSYLNYINYTDRNFFNSNLGFMYTYDFSNELRIYSILRHHFRADLMLQLIQFLIICNSY
jgi:hypothetical protein